MSRRSPLVLALAAVALAACGSSEKKSCDPVSQSGCDAGKVCEQVVGGTTGCFDPLLVSGLVTDLASGAAIAGARVVALDVDGGPVSTVAVSSSDAAVLGTYELRVPSRRAADGTPVATSVTLRADASGYEPFPSGLRVALPIALGAAVQESAAWRVDTSQTDVGLLPMATVRGGSIAGTVALPASGAAVLVVAEETTTGAASTAVPDAAGAFRILNLADGTFQVRAYAQGAQYRATPDVVTVAAGSVEPTVALAPVGGAATATVSGDINIVAAGGLTSPATSVILVLASTFDPVRVRGDAPAGLRAGGVVDTWSISGVPDGHYRVLAGFETDYLVRDPSDIGGTAVLELQVVDGVPLRMDGVSSAATLGSFKVTKAVQLAAPLPDAAGACATPVLPVGPADLRPGACSTATAPAIGWLSYSSQDFYEVTVVDERGSVAWRARVDKLATGTTYGAAVGTDGVQAVQAGPAPLVSGAAYQVRVAARNDPKTPGGAEETLSSSEDLLGVFVHQP